MKWGLLSWFRHEKGGDYPGTSFWLVRSNVADALVRCSGLLHGKTWRTIPFSKCIFPGTELPAQGWTRALHCLSTRSRATLRMKYQCLKVSCYLATCEVRRNVWSAWRGRVSSYWGALVSCLPVFGYRAAITVSSRQTNRNTHMRTIMAAWSTDGMRVTCHTTNT